MVYSYQGDLIAPCSYLSSWGLQTTVGRVGEPEFKAQDGQFNVAAWRRSYLNVLAALEHSSWGSQVRLD